MRRGLVLLLVVGCSGEPPAILATDAAPACEPGTSQACGERGVQECGVDETWGGCEECDGLDDDGDGATDEGFACTDGQTLECLTSCATLGVRVCEGCWWSACLAVEACDGEDDDCDGQTDEGFACTLGSSEPCPTTCGSEGIRVCEGCAWGDNGPKKEKLYLVIGKNPAYLPADNASPPVYAVQLIAVLVIEQSRRALLA